MELFLYQPISFSCSQYFLLPLFVVGLRCLVATRTCAQSPWLLAVWVLCTASRSWVGASPAALSYGSRAILGRVCKKKIFKSYQN